LWHRFTEASSAAEFANAWLTLQISMLDKVSRGIVVLGPAERGPFVPAAGWPEGDDMPVTLSRAAESAMAERRGIVNRSSQGESPSQLAYPLLVDNLLFGVVALEFSFSRPNPVTPTVISNSAAVIQVNNGRCLFRSAS
jgi:hypothetical protein